MISVYLLLDCLYVSLSIFLFLFVKFTYEVV